MHHARILRNSILVDHLGFKPSSLSLRGWTSSSKFVVYCLVDTEGFAPSLVAPCYWSLSHQQQVISPIVCPLFLVGAERFELSTNGLKVRCATAAPYSQILVEKCGFDPLPEGRILQTRCQSHWLSFSIILYHIETHTAMVLTCDYPYYYAFYRINIYFSKCNTGF